VNNTLSARFNVDATRAAECRPAASARVTRTRGRAFLMWRRPMATTSGASARPIRPRHQYSEWCAPGKLVSTLYFFRPIQRGRVWFSDAISLQHTFTLVRELPDDANTAVELRGQSPPAAIQLQPKAYFARQFSLQPHARPESGPRSTPSGIHDSGFHQQRAFVSLKDQIWLYDTLIELGVAADARGGISFRRAQRLTFCW